MNPISNSPTIAPVPGPDDPAPASVASELVRAVLVGGGMETRLKQTLQGIGQRDFDVSSADLLRLQFQNAELSVWTGTVDASIPSGYAPLKDAAGKLAS